jgi:hypothetical protein
MMQGTQDGFNAGFQNFVGGLTDRVGDLVTTATKFEEYKLARDNRGQGQSDLANSVETNYNEKAANVGNNPQQSSPVTSQTMLYVGAAFVGVIALALLIKR